MTETADWQKLPTRPLISVNMLAYRHERFLAHAINGVVAQRCGFPIELIVSEDCSPDETLAVALSYQRRYPELIRVLTSDNNVGMYANAARCLQASRGDYIAICEGDDYWCDDSKLARQIEVFQSHPCCTLVYHASSYIDSETGEKMGTSRQSLISRILTTDEVIVGDGGLIPTASIVVRKNVAMDPPKWYLEAPIGDYPLALRAASMGRIAYIDRVMSVYRTNVPHSWTQRHVSDIKSRIAYAQQMESMFHGFSADCGNRFESATREMISKYYSDPLVRLPGSAAERSQFYDQFASKLRGSDRWLAWIAARLRIRLPLVKDVLRKARSARRLIRAHLVSARIRTPERSTL